MAKRSRTRKLPGAIPVQTTRVADLARTATLPGADMPPHRPWYLRDWLLALLLVIAVFLTYHSVSHAGFVWDDDDHITANPTVIGPLGLKEIWTTGAGDIAPLTRSTFWLEYKVFGLRPQPYHLINLLLQAACAILLWQVLRRLRVPGAWLGAAIWTLHPLQVESVAWISEMKNTESGLFFLLSIFFFVEEIRKQESGAAQSPKRSRLDRRYALTLLFAALAMVAKASTMILPASLCLCEWWLRGRWRWRSLLKMIPVVIMSVLASAMAIWATARRQSVSHDHPLVATLSQRIIGAGDALWFYLGKLVWPHPLMALYPDFKIDSSHWYAYLPLLVFVAALLLLWPRRLDRAPAPAGPRSPSRPYFFALAWFITALLPALGLVDPYTHRYSAGYSLVYDHFQYLAGMAPLALAAAGIARLTNLAIPGGTPARSWLRLLPAAALLLLLAFASSRRAPVFQSNQTLWTNAVAGNPDCWSCHYNLGVELLLAGNTREASHEFQAAVDINPAFAKAQNNLGIALTQQGRDDAAIGHFQKALEEDPDFAEAHYNLGNALARKGRDGEAVAQFQNALEINPDYPDASNNLGIILARDGRQEQAIRQYNLALKLNPNYAEAHFNLGDALAKQGRLDEAIVQFQTSLQMNPGYSEVHEELGIALARKGRMEEAKVQFQEALRLNPNFGNARDNLAKVETYLAHGGHAAE